MNDELLKDAPVSEAETSSPAARTHHLEALMVKRKRFAYADKTLYRVYDKPDHFQLVEADSAHEAFAKSGLKTALKIQREAFYHYVALDADKIESTDDVIEVDVQLPDAEEKKILLDAALLERYTQEEIKPFEALSLSQLFASAPEETPEASAAALQADEPPSDMPEESVQPEPEEAPEEEPEKLSASDVNALLNAQES